MAADYTRAVKVGNLARFLANLDRRFAASGAEANQNAFSRVAVGSTNVDADSATDTLTLAAGSNVTLTADAGADKVTIEATDTTYSAMTAAELSAGTSTAARTVSAKVVADYVDEQMGVILNGSY